MPDTDQNPTSNEQISPYTLLRSTRMLMGDIILIGAELDLLTSLVLFQLCNLDPSRGFALFGRMGVGQKIQKILYILDVEGPDEKRIAFLELKPRLDQFIKARNTIAHGFVAGRIENSVCFFITEDIAALDQETVVFTLRRLLIDGFPLCKDSGKLLVHAIRTIFDVAPLLETVPYIIQKKKLLSPSSQRRNANREYKSPQ